MLKFGLFHFAFTDRSQFQVNEHNYNNPFLCNKVKKHLNVINIVNLSKQQSDIQLYLSVLQQLTSQQFGIIQQEADCQNLVLGRGKETSRKQLHVAQVNGQSQFVKISSKST